MAVSCHSQILQKTNGGWRSPLRPPPIQQPNDIAAQQSWSNAQRLKYADECAPTEFTTKWTNIITGSTSTNDQNSVTQYADECTPTEFTTKWTNIINAFRRLASGSWQKEALEIFRIRCGLSG